MIIFYKQKFANKKSYILYFKKTGFQTQQNILLKDGIFENKIQFLCVYMQKNYESAKPNYKIRIKCGTGFF